MPLEYCDFLCDRNIISVLRNIFSYRPRVTSEAARRNGANGAYYRVGVAKREKQ